MFYSVLDHSEMKAIGEKGIRELGSSIALWFKRTKNKDVSTGSLACPFAHSFVTRSIALICLLTRSLTLKPMGKWMIRCLNIRLV